ncbi:cobW-domain-containing protein [Fragilariopsis cylindrus CCMP1102]|uniref:CobW-domain-containing protein n=1 Tax=Fragilariopsis cylindrus CCMP1102 TaxID=635003 RepID=A0A1E7F289_9STRA|nr:cobW-domain-containing protein [Fragilariopsis cylindrus CCMP1102]|eukprot:OEU12125.1 cobW-domain-containing protein [Fragilariopsis cylindrus CCMP1102]
MASSNNDYDSSDADDDEAPDLILVTPDYDGDNNTAAASSSVVAVDTDTADTDASVTFTSTNPTFTPTSPSNNNEQDNNKEKQEQEQKQAKPCPVTILTGFLGSGKTTLINYILKSPDHGKRIAVIENEFGGLLSVESLIARDGINDSDGNNNNTLQDLIELPNGCICCTVKDTLIVTLELLIAKKRNEIDYIIIEASGVADPGPIASIFWLDETLESRLKLDGIICMIDCKHIVHQISDTEEASKQIAYADRIILNKIDLLAVDEEGDSIQDIETEIRKIHPIVPILHTSYSKIPNLNWILDADCFGGSSRIEEVELSLNGDSLFCTDVNVNNNQHPPTLLPYNIPLQNSYKHKHTSSISTVAFEMNGSLSIKKLNAWLADILWPNQDESDKRLDDFDLDPRRYIVQGVYDLWDIHPASGQDLNFQQDEKRIGKIIIIGKHLEEQELKEGFQECFCL